MARRSRDRTDRDVFTSIAKPRLAPSIRIVDLLRSIEDRRLFNPEQDFAPARGFSRRDQSEVHDPNVNRNKSKPFRYRNLFGPTRFAFSSPNKVVLCVRRAKRREVLFALKKTRSGKGGSRRRNFYTGVSCK